MRKAVFRQAIGLLAVLVTVTPAYSDVSFPVKVGNRPESITQGFRGNYYVTVMNGKEEGDGAVVEVSDAGVSVFATGFDEPQGIAYDIDLSRIGAGLRIPPPPEGKRVAVRIALTGGIQIDRLPGSNVQNRDRVVFVPVQDRTGMVVCLPVRIGAPIHTTSLIVEHRSAPAPGRGMSSEINRRVEAIVLPLLRDGASVGREVRFVGAVELADSEPAGTPMKVVPERVEVRERF